MNSYGCKDSPCKIQDVREWNSRSTPFLKYLFHLQLTFILKGDIQARQEKYGKNVLEDKKKNPILKYFSYFANPLAYAMEVAALISLLVFDWLDFGLILGLLFVNATIGYWEESISLFSSFFFFFSSIFRCTLIIHTKQEMPSMHWNSSWHWRLMFVEEGMNGRRLKQNSTYYTTL